jgi:phospholipid transport system transporter-binding protein
MHRDNLMLSIDALTFQTAREALEQGAAAIKAGSTVIDLGNVHSTDSSGVAVLLAWQRKARAARQALAYVNVPPSLLSLASLYGVDDLLPQA